MRQILTAAALSLCALTAHAGEEAEGAALFAEYCASCHGMDATGGGPMAPLLVLGVPDLTGISARAGGAFPLIAVIETIDGRTPYRGHGGPMPVFGRLGGASVALDGPGGEVYQTRAEALALARHLEALQGQTR